MNRTPAKMTARYPGRCLCGANFQPGAAIYWDGSVRRATGCPACAPRKAVAGEPIQMSGLTVRFDRHPDTGAVILCHVTDPCGAYGACETYAMTGGGPVIGTTTLPLLVYKEAFELFKMGKALAIAVIMMLCMLVLIAAYLRSVRNAPASEEIR